MNEQKARILAHPHPIIKALNVSRRHPWRSVSLGTIALLGMVTAFALVPATDEPSIQTQIIREKLAPPNFSVLQSVDHTFLREESIRRSDSVSSLMNRLGVIDPEAISFIRSNASTQAIFTQLQPGKVLTAKTGERGELLSLYFPLNQKDTVLVIERQKGGSGASDQFTAEEETLALEPQLVVRSGEIKYSLFGATDSADIPDRIAIQLAEIFSGDIDFYKDLRKGDRFSLVYEMYNHAGQAFRSGRILAAEFTNNGKTHTAHWFETESGKGEKETKGAYYTANGGTLKKAFLRSPLEFSRVSSGFSNARQHPILNTIRAHKGIDYAAPSGTPVRAVADAKVEFMGVKNGFGNLVILKHQGAYSTAYAHLKGFAPNLRKNASVSQGDTIGYVGQTGLSTGPHLHYEFRVNSAQVNPLSLKLPDSIPLERAQIARFKSAILPLTAKLELAKRITLAKYE